MNQSNFDNKKNKGADESSGSQNENKFSRIPEIEEEFIGYKEFEKEIENDFYAGEENGESEVIEIEYILPPPPPQMPFPPRMGRIPPRAFPPPAIPPMATRPFGTPPMGRPPFPPPFGLQAKSSKRAKNPDANFANVASNKKSSGKKSSDSIAADKKIYYDAEEYLDPINEDAPSQFPPKGRKSIADMRSKRAEEMLEIGKRKAISNKKTSFLNALGLFARIVFSVVFLGILIGGCFLLIRYYYEKISERGRITEEMLEKSEEQASSGYWQWAVPDNEAGIFLKKFYESLGDINTISNLNDMLLKGEIERNGVKEEFYCLQKNGRSFVKIGLGAKERAYLVGLPGEGVYLLNEGRTTGEKHKLEENEALLIRALVIFDEPLFMRVFSDNNETKRPLITYNGKLMFEGAESPVLSVREQDLQTKYYLDSKTGLIRACILSSPKLEISVSYSKYTSVDNVQTPEIRTISINGKTVASVTMDFMVRNRGMMFPR